MYLGLTHRAGGVLSRDKKSLRILWMIILGSVFFGVMSAAWFPFASCRSDTRCASSDFLFSSVVWFCAGIRSAISENFLPSMSRFIPNITSSNQARTDLFAILPTPARYRFPRSRPFDRQLDFVFDLHDSDNDRISPADQRRGTRVDRALGEQYRSYQQRTKRLIPFIY